MWSDVENNRGDSGVWVVLDVYHGEGMLHATKHVEYIPQRGAYMSTAQERAIPVCFQLNDIPSSNMPRPEPGRMSASSVENMERSKYEVIEDMLRTRMSLAWHKAASRGQLSK